MLTAINLLVFFLQVLTEECKGAALFTTNTKEQFTTNTTTRFTTNTTQINKNTTPVNKNINIQINNKFTTNTTTRSGRHRRWDEEAYDDYSEGEIDYKDESEEESRIKKLLLNWEKLALKFIFAISFIVMIVCCIVNWLMKWVKNIYRSCAVCFKLCAASCCSCFLEGDANYQRAKMFAERFGLKLSYENYKQLMDTAKKGAEQAAQSQMQSM
uniref:Uncharacterized protein n=1 Tax=Magallana gigas TaxID=29159 RepID=A0A8W8NZZ3_MAGGI